MDWYVLDDQYINYLKNYDKKVPDIDYGPYRMKAFIGIVLKTIDGFDYLAPLTSYKPRFQEMSDSIEFIKIRDNNGRILGALDINYMVPAPQSCYEMLTLDNIGNYRRFKDEREKYQYWRLLKKELNYLNQKEVKVKGSAERLLHLIEQNPNHPLAHRCCSFGTLEMACRKWEYLENINEEAKEPYQVGKFIIANEGFEDLDINENDILEIVRYDVKEDIYQLENASLGYAQYHLIEGYDMNNLSYGSDCFDSEEETAASLKEELEM